jgi:hypothetical protein
MPANAYFATRDPGVALPPEVLVSFGGYTARVRDVGHMGTMIEEFKRRCPAAPLPDLTSAADVGAINKLIAAADPSLAGMSNP